MKISLYLSITSFLFGILFLTSVSPSHAAGEFCCNQYDLYISGTNMCHPPSGKGDPYSPNCEEPEKCLAHKDEDRGVCTESNTIELCCTDGRYAYAEATGTCKPKGVVPGGSPLPDIKACPNGGFCAYGRFCVEGVNNQAFNLAQFKVCNNIPPGDARDECEACIKQGDGGTDSTNHMYTAIGCIPTSPQGLIESVLKLAIGIGGGIALLLMIFGAFQVAISGGDPKTADAGKQMFTSAIIGLLFIIFSVVILQLIGVEILQLPGF